MAGIDRDLPAPLKSANTRFVLRIQPVDAATAATSVFGLRILKGNADECPHPYPENFLSRLNLRIFGVECAGHHRMRIAIPGGDRNELKGWI